MTGHKSIHLVTFTLLVVGGLNWLLWGLFEWEIGQLFGGMDAAVSKEQGCLLSQDRADDAYRKRPSGKV